MRRNFVLLLGGAAAWLNFFFSFFLVPDARF